MLALLCLMGAAHGQEEGERPNILWLTSEDNSPYIGAYGDPYDVTPTLDALAERGVLYENALANAPVCSANRATIITGMYSASLGNHNQRSMVKVPFPFFPSYLREAGYYCTNHVKQDYNAVAPKDTWDESSFEAHYKNRAPGQPFFAVFNFGETHEGRLHSKEVDTSVVDPDEITLPPYHPDTPTFRNRWSHYYSKIRLLDEWVADHLERLEEAGLAENTIVFYFSDHGGGMPRGKRYLFESGIRIPLIIYAPEKWRHLLPDQPGSRADEIVTAVDLAPTVLSLAGIPAPEQMQGRPFLGDYREPAPSMGYVFRGRMGEVVDMQRGVRTGQYLYVRNYHPFQPNGAYSDYLWRNPAMEEWRELYDAGKLNEIQSRFFEPKPAEQLFDIRKDPYCINNLSAKAEYKDVLHTLRQANREHLLEIRDTGFLPEGMLRDAAMNTTPYEFVRSGDYPLEKYMAAADVLLEVGTKEGLWRVRKLLLDEDPAMQHWGLIACKTIGIPAKVLVAEIQQLLSSDVLEVKILAEDYLAEHTRHDPRRDLLPILLNETIFDMVRMKAAAVLLKNRERCPVSRETLESIKDCPYTLRVVNRYLELLDEE